MADAILTTIPFRRKHTAARPAPQGPPHTLDLTSARLVGRLLLTYGFSPAYARRAAFVVARSLPGLPLRMYDRIATTARVARTRIERPPVFIIGHWRSGTTHLHNLLSCDPQFGLLSMYHCMAPHTFLTLPQRLRVLFERQLPDERPMDGVKLSVDAPQEEELAMGRLCTISWNHAWNFPQHMREIFNRAVLFEGNSKVAAQWKRAYLWLLRRLTIDQQGRQLCLKNPPNTARIRQLLELFPDARFIHIYRNPYVVYRSTVHLHEKLLANWTLQTFDRREIEDNILDIYQRLLQRYFADKDLIPAGHLAEVRFEDLENDPRGEVERVYSELSLNGYNEARPRIETYLSSLGGYRKNEYQFDPQQLKRVRDAWAFTIDRWGYAAP